MKRKLNLVKLGIFISKTFEPDEETSIEEVGVDQFRNPIRIPLPLPKYEVEWPPSPAVNIVPSELYDEVRFVEFGITDKKELEAVFIAHSKKANKIILFFGD